MEQVTKSIIDQPLNLNLEWLTTCNMYFRTMVYPKWDESFKLEYEFVCKDRWRKGGPLNP